MDMERPIIKPSVHWKKNWIFKLYEKHIACKLTLDDYDDDCICELDLDDDCDCELCDPEDVEVEVVEEPVEA